MNVRQFFFLFCIINCNAFLIGADTTTRNHSKTMRRSFYSLDTTPNRQSPPQESMDSAHSLSMKFPDDSLDTLSDNDIYAELYYSLKKEQATLKRLYKDRDALKKLSNRHTIPTTQANLEIENKIRKSEKNIETKQHHLNKLQDIIIQSEQSCCIDFINWCCR